MRRLLAGAIAACFVAACQEGQDGGEVIDAPIVRASTAPVAAVQVDGLRTVTAADLRARAKAPNVHGLVVNVWASWCGSCRQEIPLLLQLRDAFRASGLDFAFVSADEAKAYARAVELMRGWGGPAPVLAVGGSLRAFKGAMSPDWRGGIPATFLFDAQGKLRHLWEGPILEHEIAPVLQEFLSGQNVDGETRTAAAPR